ncbi:MAG: GHKL domain-containing protein [Lachnospiraceae bacterium]|nr:GHKL domain-containing protein [Lachnospiraceae bacterium]
MILYEPVFFWGALIQFALMVLTTSMQTVFYYTTIGLNPKWAIGAKRDWHEERDWGVWHGLRLALAILFIAVIKTVLQFAAVNINSAANILFFIVIILYPVIFMGGKRKEQIFFGIVSAVLFQFSFLLSLVLLYPRRNLMTDSLAATLVIFILFITIYAALMLVFAHLNTDGKRYIPSKYWTGMIICFSIVLVNFHLISFAIGLNTTDRFHTYLVILTFGFLMMWSLLYLIFYFVCRYFSKATEANTLIIQNEMIERYMLRKQASDERIQILSHDLKHSLTQWRRLAEEKGDENALQNITEYEKQLFSALLVNVENESANAIINQKYWEAGQKKVKFIIDGVFQKDLLISKLDLCSLLGNLLDNAIEAAQLAETDALRYVKMVIRRKGNLLIIIAENGYAITPAIENGVFMTHKKNKDLHGIGMLSIRYVADKYNGVVTNSFEDNLFKTTLMLKGYQNVLSNEI